MPRNWQYNKERGADINLNQKSRYLNKVFKDEVKVDPGTETTAGVHADQSTVGPLPQSPKSSTEGEIDAHESAAQDGDSVVACNRLTGPAGQHMSSPRIVAAGGAAVLLTDGAGERGRGNDEATVPSGCGGGPCPGCIRRHPVQLGAQRQALSSHGGQ